MPRMVPAGGHRFSIEVHPLMRPYGSVGGFVTKIQVCAGSTDTLSKRLIDFTRNNKRRSTPMPTQDGMQFDLPVRWARIQTTKGFKSADKAINTPDGTEIAVSVSHEIEPAS